MTCYHITVVVAIVSAIVGGQGCQLLRFSWKLPEFEAYFTRLRIFDETPEFRSHPHIFTAKRHRTIESTCKLCRLVHFQSGTKNVPSAELLASAQCRL